MAANICVSLAARINRDHDINKLKFRQGIEILGVVGVIMSLIYVGYELRQNTIATRSQSHQALSDVFIGAVNDVMTDQDLARIIAMGSNDINELSEGERHQFTWYVTGEMIGWELAFYSYHDGALLDEVWESWDSGYCRQLRSTGFRESWEIQASGGIGWGSSFYEHVTLCLATG